MCWFLQGLEPSTQRTESPLLLVSCSLLHMVELLEVYGIFFFLLLSLALSHRVDLMVDLQTQDHLPAKMAQVLPLLYS